MRIERGHHISLRDEIHGCTSGIFSKSTDAGEFAVTDDMPLQSNSVPGVLTGESAMSTSPTTPIDAKTFRPLKGSAILEESQLGHATATTDRMSACARLAVEPG